MTKIRIIRKGINKTLAILTITSIICIFLPWFHGKGSISYSGGGISGGGSARTASVSGLSTGTGLFLLILEGAYLYLLWKKKTGQRIVFFLLPLVIFLCVIMFAVNLSDSGMQTNVGYGVYGGSARASAEPDFGYFLFALLAFFSLIFSPFRTRKIKADETELLFNSEASTSISEKPKEEGALELIEKLNRLKENGTITAEEFDSKKKELLSRI